MDLLEVPLQQPMRFWILLRFRVGPISIEFPLKGNTLFSRVPVEDLPFKHITKSMMPFEAFVHACHIQFLQPRIFVSDTCGILILGICVHRNS